MVPADGYVIIDTETGKVWDNRSHKRVWEKSSYAKNAWNVKNSGLGDHQKFNDQKRYVCRPVRFVDMETGDYLT